MWADLALVLLLLLVAEAAVNARLLYWQRRLVEAQRRQIEAQEEYIKALKERGADESPSSHLGVGEGPDLIDLGGNVSVLPGAEAEVIEAARRVAAGRRNGGSQAMDGQGVAVVTEKRARWYVYPLTPVAWICVPFVRVFIWILDVSTREKLCRHRHQADPAANYTDCLDCGSLVVGRDSPEHHRLFPGQH